jgi:hypothetical protein
MQEDTSNAIHRVRERVVVGEGHDSWFDGMCTSLVVQERTRLVNDPGDSMDILSLGQHAYILVEHTTSLPFGPVVDDAHFACHPPVPRLET